MVLADTLKAIPLKSDHDLRAMGRAGALAAETLAYSLSLVGPDVVTADIDRLVDTFIRDHGAVPAPLHYQGFPRSTCISANDVICHGIPGPWRLRAGDIVCIDITVILDGFHGDTAATVPVGPVTKSATALMRTTLEACRLGIEAVGPEGRLGDVGHAIQEYVEANGYSVVRNFVGHGIGRAFHEPPQVRHFGRAGTGPKLRPGMTFTVEPMVNVGDWHAKVLRDGWTAVTEDGSLSAQYEHTVAVTTDGVRLLTVPVDRPGTWEPPGGVRI